MRACQAAPGSATQVECWYCVGHTAHVTCASVFVTRCYQHATPHPQCASALTATWPAARSVRATLAHPQPHGGRVVRRCVVVPERGPPGCTRLWSRSDRLRGSRRPLRKRGSTISPQSRPVRDPFTCASSCSPRRGESSRCGSNLTVQRRSSACTLTIVPAMATWSHSARRRS